MRLKTFQLSNYTRMIMHSGPLFQTTVIFWYKYYRNYSQFVPCAQLNNLWTGMWALVSVDMAHASGTVSHVRQSLSSVRRIAKCTLKEFEEVTEVLNTALRFLCFPSCCSSLFYSLISPRTSRGSGSILAFCLHFRFWASLLGRSSSLALQIFCHFDVVTMRPLAPLQHWER